MVTMVARYVGAWRERVVKENPYLLSQNALT